MTPFKNGVAFVEQNGKPKFIDPTGKQVEEPDDQDFYDGLALEYDQKDRVGYVNEAGDLVVPCMYDDGMDFNEGMAPVCLKGKWGFIDTTGKQVIACKYDDFVDSFQNGLAMMQMGDDFGFIGIDGTEYWED